MSAYIVEDNTINKAVSRLIDITKDSDDSWITYDLLKKYNLNDIADAKRLAHDMFLLNIRSVNARYADNPADQFRSLHFKFEYIPLVNKFAAIKALDCWQYQCCESDIPETSELYQLMDKIIGNMSKAIILKMPQYYSA